MFSKVRKLIAVGALMLLMLPATVFADAAPAEGASPANPLPLSSGIQGNLPANSGGAFEYLQFNYPGDGSTMTLTMTVDNAVPIEVGSAGINVYMGGNLIASSTAPSPTTATVSFASTAAGPALIQIWNYDPTYSIAFTLTSESVAG